VSTTSRIARGRKYATVLIDAVSHRRVDVLPDRKAATLATWLREHPRVEAGCRDGSAAYAEAIRQATLRAVQASDRWHLWLNLAATMEKTVVALHLLEHHSQSRRIGAGRLHAGAEAQAFHPSDISTTLVRRRSHGRRSYAALHPASAPR
jgi:hypothetical protein